MCAVQSPKGLEDLEIRGWVDTILTTVLLRLAWILRVMEIEEICCHSNSSGKPSANKKLSKE